MATCGYLCPLCEGRGIDESGNACTWCTVEVKTASEAKMEKNVKASDEELQKWIKDVHEGPCCGDL